MINPTEKYQQFVSLIKDNQGIIFKVIRSYTISKEDEERLLRLLYLSIGTIIASYCIGLNTLVYAHK